MGVGVIILFLSCVVDGGGADGSDGGLRVTLGGPLVQADIIVLVFGLLFEMLRGVEVVEFEADGFWDVGGEEVFNCLSSVARFATIEVSDVI
jgi:hypothetical protein